MLLDESEDVDERDIKALVTTLRAKNDNNLVCHDMGEEIRDVACREDERKSETPIRDIVEILLCIIDRLVGGSGTVDDLRNGTSRLYADTHLVPTLATKGIITYHLGGYTYIEVGRYGYRQSHACVRVAMHRLMCWLRWGTPSNPKSIVCHDPRCPRSTCVSLACLRWGDNARNARDRVARGAHRRARQGRASPGDAQASECIHARPKRSG